MVVHAHLSLQAVSVLIGKNLSAINLRTQIRCHHRRRILLHQGRH